jgi:hypothetical protein
MSIIIPPELHRQFKIATAAREEEMTTVLLDFIRQYIQQNLPESLAKKPGRRA